MREHNNYRQDRGYRSGPVDRYNDAPPNFGSARSDYGGRAYGGRLNAEGLDRGWLDRTADEVSSWFGNEEAERRRRMDERRGEFHDRRDRHRDFSGSRRQYYESRLGPSRRH